MVTLMALFTATTLQLGLPPNLLSSLCYVESTYDITAVHHDDGGTNSLGVCQIKLKTAKWLGFKGNELELMKPEVNIYYSGKYLAYQLRRYKGNITKAVIAYNFGNAKNLTSSKYQRKVFNKWRQK